MAVENRPSIDFVFSLFFLAGGAKQKYTLFKGILLFCVVLSNFIPND